MRQLVPVLSALLGGVIAAVAVLALGPGSGAQEQIPALDRRLVDLEERLARLEAAPPGAGGVANNVRARLAAGRAPGPPPALAPREGLAASAADPSASERGDDAADDAATARRLAELEAKLDLLSAALAEDGGAELAEAMQETARMAFDRLHAAAQVPLGGQDEDAPVGLDAFDEARNAQETAAALLGYYRGRNSLGSTDPAILRAMEAGPDVVPPLLSALDATARGMERSASLQVIRKMARPEHDRALLDAFRNHLDLAAVIQARGLGEQALPTIRSRMAIGLDWYPTDFIDLVIDLRQVDLYSHVLDYLRRGSNRGSTAKALVRAVERGDPVNPVPALLEAVGSEQDYDRLGVAEVLCRLGRREGLAPLVRLAKTGDGWLADQARKVLAEVVAHDAPPAVIPHWVEENLGALRWDGAARRFAR